MKPEANTAIRAIGLCKTYGNHGNVAGTRVRAVENATLSVNPGEVLLIEGPNGSGKTTLLSMLGCLLPPTRGSLRILDEEVTGLSQARLTAFRIRNIGFVFQTFRLLNALTVSENVELPMALARASREGSARRTRELLDEFRLSHRAGFFPTVLSGGERQRAAMARAFANNPFVILADEPTGSLDSRSGRAAVESLCAAARRHGAAVVIVSHDRRIEPFADRILCMEDGRLTGRIEP
jgi:putative ABC transport system ATP-binding protein